MQNFNAFVQLAASMAMFGLTPTEYVHQADRQKLPSLYLLKLKDVPFVPAFGSVDDFHPE